MAEGKSGIPPQNLVVSQKKYDFSYQQIGRWLPYSAEPAQVEDFLANITLYPQARPQTLKELEFYQSLLREIIRSNQKEEAQIEFLVISEEISKICRFDSEGLLVALDGFLPWGLVKIFKINENGPKVATVVCLEGEIDKGEKNKQVAQVYLDFGLAQKQKMMLDEDDLTLIPVSAEEKVILEIKCLGNFRICQKKDLKIEVTGGTVGIVFDTRGRPFRFPDFSPQGRGRVVKWRKALGII